MTSRYEVLATVLLKFPSLSEMSTTCRVVNRDVLPSSSGPNFPTRLGLLGPEDESNTIHRNVGNYVLIETA